MSHSEFAPLNASDTRTPLTTRFAARAPAIAFVLIALYALFRAVVNAGLLPGRLAVAIDWMPFVAANAAMAYFSWRASRYAREGSATRRAWTLLTVGGTLAAFASCSETFLDVAYGITLLPIWLHALFAVIYSLMIAGLMSFPSAPRLRADRLTFFFDVATVGLSALMIMWFWCVRTGVFDSATSLSNKLLVIGYPSADLAVLLTSAILLVRSAEDRSRRIFTFFVIGNLCSAIADFWYGYLQVVDANYPRDTFVDVCWYAGVLLPAVAAATQLTQPSLTSSKPGKAKWVTEVPLIAVALAFATLFMAMRDDLEHVVIQLGVGAAVLTIMSIARQRISSREAARLMEERAIRDARFRALVQHSTDLVIVLDDRLIATYVSPAAESMLGIGVEDAIGRSFVDWITADDRDAVAEVLGGVARTPLATDSLVCRIRHADGSARSMDTVVRNLLSDPAVSGIILNSRDITQRLALEAQLLHTQKLEVVGRLAGGIAHDFNNLLMVIGANADFVLSDDSDVVARRDAAQEIKETTKRAAALTKQLLAFSRRQDTKPSVLNPNAVVRHVEHMLLRLMQHAARFEVDLIAEPRNIVIDPGQLEQALLNLAVNARDAMPGGGVLTMRTRNATVKSRTVVDRGVLAPGEYVAISVIDSGSGMSAEVTGRVFEPFFTTKAIGSGTGLGLAMVLGVIQQAGGQVHLQSEIGKGTNITLYLPVARDHAGEPVARPEPMVSRGTGRILVVDDEEGVRTVLQRLLRRMGYEVEAVADASTAFALLGVTPLRFDLVLSDILMPEKTGIELAAEVIEAGYDVAFVLMTGFADSATVREATEVYRLKVLRKPFEMEQLSAIVEEALNLRSEARTSVA